MWEEVRVIAVPVGENIAVARAQFDEHVLTATAEGKRIVRGGYLMRVRPEGALSLGNEYQAIRQSGEKIFIVISGHDLPSERFTFVINSRSVMT